MANYCLLALITVLSSLNRYQSVELNRSPPYPVFQVKFEVNPQNASRILSQMLNNEQFDPDMPAAILLTNTNLPELSLDQWKQIVSKSKLDFGRFTLEKMKEVIKVLKISTTKELNMVIESKSEEQFDKAMDTLGVNVENVILYMWKNREGDEKLLDNFKEANFAKWNLAMKEMGMTPEDIFLFAKTSALRNLNQVSLVNVTRLMRNITGEVKLDPQNLRLNQTSSNFIDSAFDVLEVYQDDDIFRTMIQTYNNSLTTSTLLTTRVNTGHYLSSKPVHEEIMQMKNMFAKPYLVNETKWKHPILNMTLNGSLVDMSTNDTNIFISPQHFVTQLAKCQYTTSLNQSTEVPVQMVKGQLSILAWPVKYIKGAPLFCDGQLIGIASSQTIDRIMFTKTEFKMAEVLPTPPDSNKEPAQPPAQNNSVQIPLGFLMKVSLYIKPEKLPYLFGYLLFDSVSGNRTKTNLQGISATDLVSAYSLRTLTYVDFVRMLQHVNMKPVPFEITKTLQHFNVPLIPTYKAFSTRLTPHQERNLLANLNFSQIEMDKVLGTNDDATFLKFLSGGNFSRGNIERALFSGGIAESIIYDVVKTAIFEQTARLNVAQIVNFFQNYGGYPSFSKMISQMDTIEHQDFYQPRFRRILTSFMPKVENVTYLASAISEKYVITVVENFMNDHLTMDFISFNVQDYTGDKLDHEAVTVVEYQSGYSNATIFPRLASDHGVINVATGMYPKGCSVVLGGRTVDIELKLVKAVAGGFEVIISNEEVLTGAPLVCEGKLFGVCKGQIGDKVHFAGFRDPKVAQHDLGHGTMKPGTGTSSADKLRVSFDIFVYSCILVYFTSFML